MTMTTTTVMTMTTTTTTTTTRTASAAVWGWRQHSFRAMNTGVFAQFYTASRRSPERVAESLFRYYEQLLSRFLPASELSRLNDHDGTVFAAGADLFAAVEASLWAAQQTGGIFDPTILPYLEQAGYDRTFVAVPHKRPLTAAEPSPPDDAPRSPAPAGPDYRHVQLDPFSRLIIRPVGLQFDLGGMGKGWTVDRVVDELRDAGVFLINAGGDLFAHGRPPGEAGWEIHLAHPLDPRLRIATLSVAHRAVATSTVARRRWLRDGRVMHHLIDPRLGLPAVGDVVSVSVVGGRAFTAEVYAKTALILGREAGRAFLESLPDVEGLLVLAGGEIVTTSGMVAFIKRLNAAGYPSPDKGA